MKNEAKVVNCSGLMTKLLITMPLLPPPAPSLSARCVPLTAAAVVSFRLAYRYTYYVVRTILKMFLKPVFLKPVWVGKIHGVEVYATHVVRIWWFVINFLYFNSKGCKRLPKKLPLVK